MHKGKIKNRLKISKFTRTCMVPHSTMTEWQELLLLFFPYKSFEFSAAVADATAENLQDILFNMLFNITNCLCVYRKLITLGINL